METFGSTAEHVFARRQFAATAVLLVVGWLLVGGSIGILVASVAVSLIGVVIRALNTTIGGRADRVAIPEMVDELAEGIQDHNRRKALGVGVARD